MTPPRQRRQEPDARDTAMVAGTNQGTAVITAKSAADIVRADVGARLEELTKALAGRFDSDWFTSAAVSQFRRTPALWEATKTPQGRASIVAGMIEAAQIGLPFLMGRMYLVPFRDHGTPAVQALIGYQGLVDKVTGPTTGVTYVEAAVVYARDSFDYRRGTGGFLHHRESEPEYDPQAPEGRAVDRGPRTHVWARVVFANGQDRWEVFKISDVERIRAMSKAKDSGPWVEHYDEMAKKTVLRNLCKTLRIDFQLMQLLEKEDQWEAGPSTGGTPDQQSVLRRQLQQRLAPDTADSGPEGAEGSEAQPTGQTADSGPVTGTSGPAGANPEGAEAKAGLWRPVDEPIKERDQCKATAASGGGRTTRCTLAAEHDGPHNDGRHDWAR